MALTESQIETLNRISDQNLPSYMPPDWPVDESVQYLGADWHSIERTNPENGFVLVPEGYDGPLYD